jgi:hypothetical protein
MDGSSLEWWRTGTIIEALSRDSLRGAALTEDLCRDIPVLQW